MCWFSSLLLLLLYVYLITLSACCTRTQTDGQPAGQTLQCCVIYGNWTCNGIGNIKKLIPIDFHEKILICRLNYNAQSHHQPITTYGGCPGTHADPPIRLEGVDMAVKPSASWSPSDVLCLDAVGHPWQLEIIYVELMVWCIVWYKRWRGGLL